MIKDPQQDLARIRDMMERSSRFISLSGLSGVAAGVLALIASVIAYYILENNGVSYFQGGHTTYTYKVLFQLTLLCGFTLIAAVGAALFFTSRNSRKKEQKLWTALTYRLLNNFMTPLLAGGTFCAALVYHSFAVLAAPVMLIFYGLALINASKYTFTDVNYLGYTELILGLIALFFPGNGLIFWAIGFGVMHIIYGMVMYKKYDLAK